MVEQLDIAKDTAIAILTTSALLLTLVSAIASYSSIKIVGLARTVLLVASLAFLISVITSLGALVVITTDAADDTQKLSISGKGWFLASFSTFGIALLLLVLVLVFSS